MPHEPSPQNRLGPSLTLEELAVYEWQIWSPQLGLAGQEKLRRASVLVTRCGGVGGAAAQYLAAAGVGRLVLAHGGVLRPSDLNRQTLMSHAALGQPRVETARRRLLELNPRLDVEAVAENVSADNVGRLVESVDLTVDAAPLFAERFLLNHEAVRQRKPLVECAMFDLSAQLTLIVPGQTPCLACLYPTDPPHWKRLFPVLGAVAGMIGSLGALEAIKHITGMGETLAGRMLVCDLAGMEMRTVQLRRRQDCAVCGG